MRTSPNSGTSPTDYPKATPQSKALAQGDSARQLVKTVEFGNAVSC